MFGFADIYKHVGLVLIILTWMGLIFLIKKWPGNKSMTLSQHAAPNKNSRLFYLLLFLITLPPFYLFITNWLVPNLSLPVIYTYVAGLAIVSQIIAAVVPDNGGLKTKIHNLGAYGMATLLIPLTGLILISSAGIVTKSLAAIATVYLVVVWLLHFFWLEKIQPHYLYFQSIYIAAFHAVILAATYIG